MVRLGVNIDHVATVRQARGGTIPDVIEAAKAAVRAGADGITAHLREDRRHIQDADIRRLRTDIGVPLNMEMAATAEMVKIAESVVPAWVCIVPEKRKELTTEGGLDVEAGAKRIASAVERLKKKGVRVSLFIEPTVSVVQSSKRLGADAVELHTGSYAHATTERGGDGRNDLQRIRSAAEAAAAAGLIVNAGHGIDYGNVKALLATHPFHELNIGYAIIARAMFVGLEAAVKEMKGLMN